MASPFIFLIFLVFTGATLLILGSQNVVTVTKIPPPDDSQSKNRRFSQLIPPRLYQLPPRHPNVNSASTIPAGKMPRGPPDANSVQHHPAQYPSSAMGNNYNHHYYSGHAQCPSGEYPRQGTPTTLRTQFSNALPSDVNKWMTFAEYQERQLSMGKGHAIGSGSSH